MRLKHIYISEYKNLKEFTLDFEGDSFIDVFVGKNGTGKSNLFEALIEIFKHLFEDAYEVNFDFKLKYELEGDDIFIGWKWAESKWLDEDEKEVKKINKEQLPDNILIYYSGHNNKITDLVETYESTFKKGLKEANEGDTREFIGIGKEYKALLLSVLLLQPDACKAKEFIIKKLGIKTIDNQVKITLKRPFYARKKGYDIDSVQAETRFWKAKGITLEFLDKLSAIKKGAVEEGKVRDEGYLYKEDYKDEFIMYLDIENFQHKFSEASPQDIFRDFDNLKTIEMLDDISIELELLDGSKIGVDKFSDGQFQSVYIYSIMELFKDRNCITLLDEPDAFLHPEWQFDFLKQVFEINDDTSESNHVLMTSHSAVTLLNSKERKINLFKFHEDKIISRKVEKGYAISQLSSKLIKVQQDKQILSVIHTIGQDRPILFTEGYSDPVILQQAWTHLYDEEIPFEICFGHGCLYLRLLLQSEKLLGEMGDFPIFGLFDFDMAYNEWNSIKGEADLEETDPYNGLIKKVLNRNSYAILVPVPSIPEIERQVIVKNHETFKENSKLEMEHLFYGAETAKHFHNVSIVGGGELIEISDSKKMMFASHIVPTLEKEYFEVFRPLFEFIVRKI
jgi:predicted ATPase